MNYFSLILRKAASNLSFVLFCTALLIFSACKQQEGPGTGPGDLQVPDGYVIEEVVSPDLISYPMFASFDDRGRLFVFESTGVNTMGTEEMLKNPTYHIRLLEDTDSDGTFDKSSIFVDNVPLPMGGTFYQGSLYAAAPPNLMRYTDTDDDGVADEKEVLLSGWVLNANAATLHGPFMGPDGWLYLCDARRGFDITTKEGVNLKGKGARIWRCRPDGSGLESMAGGGFDNSIEMVFMPGGETIGTMTYFTDPKDGQRDAIMHWVEGGVYPKYNSVIDEDNLKLTGELMPSMTKLPRIAHAGLVRYRGDQLGEGFDGNLFSAVFNTGKIVRHTIEPVGATFTTTEEDFMTSTGADIHPTDVLQDADGSLLVVVTGGWFIEGCPLSRVAKPDIRGGIYRIRKKDAPQVEDPWGKGLDLHEKSPQELVEYLTDSRTAVKDNAVEQLVAKGSEAVTPLKNSLHAGDEGTRTAAVFALARINTPESINGVRTALDDESAIVRTAATRSLGLAKDKESVDKLMELVKKDEAPVRRQAATALEQIGESRAVTALLEAADNPDDRFVEHAIIHALTLLKHPQPLVAALNNASTNVRKAAVIALDQMDGSSLQSGQLVPFLASDDATLRHTGIWIASHRPEWAGIVVDFLDRRLANAELPEEEVELIRNLMITFSGNPQLQALVARQLQKENAPNARKLFLLEVIAGSSIKELPASWTDQLGRLLLSDNVQVRTGVLGLIESRSIPALNRQIENIIQDPKAPADFRIQALSARTMSAPQLSDAEFDMLLGYLGPDFDSPVRQAAVRLLTRAELTDTQLMEIAQNQVPNADLFLVPSLVEVFQGNKNEEVGKALIASLGSSGDRLDNLSEQDLQKLLSGFPASVQAEAKPLLAILKERHAARLSKLQELQSSLAKGDITRGRKVFFGKGTCFTCHSVGGEGGVFGPDLSNIGEIRSEHDILEAIVYPSASFAREYETYKVVTGSNTYTGVIAEQLSDAVMVTVGPGPGVRVPRADITSIEPHNVSMMPPGLDQQLSKEELSDLMAFLEALPDPMKRLRVANNK